MALKLFRGVGPLDRTAILRDGLAGIALASMNIPQVLGYARIAGMPLVTGLYTALLAPVAFAIFASSRHLVVAADSGTAAILAGSLSAMASPGSPDYLALVGMVALLTAGLLLLARLFKLGFLADFLSRTVLVGFLTGVGIQIAIAMLSDMLGIAVDTRRTVVQLWELARGLGQVNGPTLALSAMVAAIILIGRRYAPRLPVSMAVVLAAIAASWWFDFAGHGIATIGPVPSGVPAFGLPDVIWTKTLPLLPVAGSCFVVIIAQSAATARVFAVRYKERVDVDADILGLAAANAAAAVGGAFVVNGSPSQTAMAEGAGARGQLAQVSFAVTVLVVLLFLTGPLQFLPRCVLASVVFAIAVRMVDIAGLRAILLETPSEFALALVTAAAVAAAGVEYGILLAIALSLLRHVRHSYHPHTMVLQPNEHGGWAPVPAAPGLETEPGLILYRFSADLFYANAGRFADEVLALIDHAPTPVRWFVVEAAAISDLDYSAARSLSDLFRELARRDVNIAFARVGLYLKADMTRHGLLEILDEGRLFPTLHGALAAVRQPQQPTQPV
ncbi:SulP family inorganic anion transporter [Aliidongia dinghuensis]|uniref:SulP family inorganic anion transporter n=1 Tax=Aliidongia dinghuensis TaxID=1867774 RepID=A0A8J3E0Z8_9PROT|nr:SulP family inorganic anion transporter [Aliidongia dinghuensis]GGF06405.1 SulP family inorganic anion transporter [Aliidongia dinghuensis]